MTFYERWFVMFSWRFVCFCGGAGLAIHYGVSPWIVVPLLLVLLVIVGRNTGRSALLHTMGEEYTKMKAEWPRFSPQSQSEIEKKEPPSSPR